MKTTSPRPARRARFGLCALALLLLPGAAWGWSGDTWGGITRATIKALADEMIDSTWVPRNTFTNFQYGSTYETYYQGATYKGVAYSQNNPQENWPQFYSAVTNTGGGSVGYGNDCSGFVSICWKLPARYTTALFESNLGTYWTSLGEIGSAASVTLLPGDALNRASSHIIMFLNYESSGLRSMEQTPDNAQRRVWSYSSLANYRPIRRLLIEDTPSLVRDGVSRVVDAGKPLTLSVSATGTAPLIYQWRFNGSNLAGATASSLTLPAVQLSDAGQYVCVVANASGSVTSRVMSVTVYPPQTTVFLDTLDGTKDLLRRVRKARRAVVIGGGITALEMAEGFAHHKLETHYLLRRNVLWASVFNEAESRLLEERMTGHGVRLHFNTEAAEIMGDKRGRVAGVRLASGATLACDLVGAGIGVKADLGFLQDSGVKTDKAILVDEFLETNVPDVYAAGDCAQAWDPWTKKHSLDVLWPTAVAQGRVAGLNMAGRRTAHVKGTPFNACLLFGLHITAIGQLGGSRDADEPEVVQHISRGSSETWATRPHAYASAWSQTGPNTVRLALSGDRLVGALVVGDQTLADPLRFLIEKQIDIRPIRPILERGGADMTWLVRQLYLRLQSLPADRLPAVAAAAG